MSPDHDAGARFQAGEHRSVDLESTFYLIERARAGDQEALERLFTRHLKPLQRWARGRLPTWARDLADTDTADAPHVALVNRGMAERRWPGASPIGRRILLPGPSNVQAPIMIVGVVADVRQSDWIGSPDDEVYLALAQRIGARPAGRSFEWSSSSMPMPSSCFPCSSNCSDRRRPSLPVPPRAKRLREAGRRCWGAAGRRRTWNRRLRRRSSARRRQSGPACLEDGLPS